MGLEHGTLVSSFGGRSEGTFLVLTARGRGSVSCHHRVLKTAEIGAVLHELRHQTGILAEISALASKECLVSTQLIMQNSADRQNSSTTVFA